MSFTGEIEGCKLVKRDAIIVSRTGFGAGRILHFINKAKGLWRCAQENWCSGMTYSVKAFLPLNITLARRLGEVKAILVSVLDRGLFGMFRHDYDWQDGYFAKSCFFGRLLIAMLDYLRWTRVSIGDRFDHKLGRHFWAKPHRGNRIFLYARVRNINELGRQQQ